MDRLSSFTKWTDYHALEFTKKKKIKKGEGGRRGGRQISEFIVIKEESKQTQKF